MAMIVIFAMLSSTISNNDEVDGERKREQKQREDKRKSNGHRK